MNKHIFTCKDGYEHMHGCEHSSKNIRCFACGYVNCEATYRCHFCLTRFEKKEVKYRPMANPQFLSSVLYTKEDIMSNFTPVESEEKVKKKRKIKKMTEDTTVNDLGWKHDEFSNELLGQKINELITVVNSLLEGKV